MIQDARDLPLGTTSAASARSYDHALDLLASYFPDPLACIDAALADDPEFVSGHCLRAGVGVMAAERAGLPLIRDALAAGRRLTAKATPRERAHFAAAQAWLDGDLHRSNELYGRIALDHPRDLLALQIAHLGDFFLGQQRLLRDRISRARPHWDRDVPGYGYVLGMHAFGLEETNLFELASATGHEALALNRRDPWAVHAIVHVCEMTGRLADGIACLRSRLDDWAPNNGLAFHNFWHLALLQLEQGAYADVLRLFDRHVWAQPSRIAIEMVDAASLLFRLHLHGVDLGARAASVADAWSDASYHGYYAFNDAHAAMAFLAAGRLDQVRALIPELERVAGEDGSNAIMTRDVGLPLTRALLAFGEARNDEVVELLMPLRFVAHGFGGSNAQREVIDQTLAEAAVRGGRPEVARAVVAERRVLRPESPWARRIERRYGTLVEATQAATSA